jgi:hypothetical protein
MPPRRRLSADELQRYHRDGFIVVPGVFSPGQMIAARAAIEGMYYDGRSFEDWLAMVDSAGGPQALEAFRRGESAGGKGGGEAVAVGDSEVWVPPELGHEAARACFPVGVSALDGLVETDSFLDIYEQCLGDKAAFCDAHLFLRAGATDTRHPSASHAGFHMDHNTNCWLPPAPDGAFGYVNATAYLNDVDADSAAMLVCPGSHCAAGAVTKRLTPVGGAGSYPFVPDLREVPELSTPVPAVGPAGSALFYSSYLYHAAQPFKGEQAFSVLFLSNFGFC